MSITSISEVEFGVDLPPRLNLIHRSKPPVSLQH